MKDETKRKIKEGAKAVGRGAKDLGGRAARASYENGKVVIKGVAKYGGKWTLKGVGKTAELMARTPIKTVNVLSRSTDFQKIATASGMLAVGVMVPTVMVGGLAAIAIKFGADHTILGHKHKKIEDEVADIVNFGHRLTKHAFGALGDIMVAMDAKAKDIGQGVQEMINEKFDGR